MPFSAVGGTNRQLTPQFSLRQLLQKWSNTAGHKSLPVERALSSWSKLRVCNANYATEYSCQLDSVIFSVGNKSIELPAHSVEQTPLPEWLRWLPREPISEIYHAIEHHAPVASCRSAAHILKSQSKILSNLQKQNPATPQPRASHPYSSHARRTTRDVEALLKKTAIAYHPIWPFCVDLGGMQ